MRFSLIFVCLSLAFQAFAEEKPVSLTLEYQPVVFKEKSFFKNNSLELNWYKQGLNAKQINDPHYYRNNILSIFIRNITAIFKDAGDIDRIDLVQMALDSLTQICNKNYIPQAYRSDIEDILQKIATLEKNGYIQAELLIFQSLSPEAQEAYKSGERVHKHDLSRNVRKSHVPDPIAIEILFMQMAEEIVNRQQDRKAAMNELQDLSKTFLDKFQRFDIPFINNLDKVLLNVAEYAEDESPLSDITRIIIEKSNDMVFMLNIFQKQLIPPVIDLWQGIKDSPLAITYRCLWHHDKDKRKQLLAEELTPMSHLNSALNAVGMKPSSIIENLKKVDNKQNESKKHSPTHQQPGVWEKLSRVKNGLQSEFVSVAKSLGFH